MRWRCCPSPSAARGVWTISAGNAGQGVAYAARRAGVPCTVVVIETAPAAKIERMRALGAKLVPVPFEVAWKALEERSFPGVDGTFVHPFDDHNFIVGHATMGLEILEDAPDTAAVIAAIGGGGLITGLASAIKPAETRGQDLGRRAGDGRTGRALVRGGVGTAVSGLEGVIRRRSGGPEPVPAHVGADAATGRREHCRHALEQTKQAMRLLAEKARVVAEGAGALSLAAALTGEAGQGPIVAIVSGGECRSEEVLHPYRRANQLR